MQLLDMSRSASKGMGEVSMPERKDIATAKDQRDCDKMRKQKLIAKKTRDRTSEFIVVGKLKCFAFRKTTMNQTQQIEKAFTRSK